MDFTKALVFLLLLLPAPFFSHENRKWVLAKRPNGAFKASNLRLVIEDVDESSLGEGQILVQTDVLSVDAFIRTTLDEEAYHGSTPIGSVVTALGLGTVIASRSKKFKPNDRVAGALGAQTLAVLHADGPTAMCTKTGPLPGVPESAALGVLGLTTGMTAWVGVHAVAGPPKRGETVVVSAAAGAVGTCAAQFARNRGARVIGVAGGAEKQAFLLNDLRLAGAVDYKSRTESLGDQLDALAPDGIDFFFDNVGGQILDACLERMRPGGRIVICGGISQYQGNLNHGRVEGPSNYLKLAEKGCSMTGFNVIQKISLLPWMLLRILVACWRGNVKLREQVESGIEAFPLALEKMFSGGHIGKLLVKP